MALTQDVTMTRLQGAFRAYLATGAKRDTRWVGHPRDGWGQFPLSICQHPSIPIDEVKQIQAVVVPLADTRYPQLVRSEPGCPLERVKTYLTHMRLR